MEPVSALEYKELETLEVIPVTCADYITKYDWNKTVAHNVMIVESGNKANNLNDTPSTGDYSVGCFQINLKGENNLRAKYRDAVDLGYTGSMSVSELKEWLWNPGNNVAVAYKMYKSSGWQPWSATTCRYKVQCY